MHYSGSTVFKLTSAISRFKQEQLLTSADKQTLELLLKFYNVPKQELEGLSEPISVLDYFSEVILNDLKNIQISCDYDEYFNTMDIYYQEFVRAVFDIYEDEGFITTHNHKKSLNYPLYSFKESAAKRLNETRFTPRSAKTMVAESLKRLDTEWSFERTHSIGTRINEQTIDPMFDAEFLSIFNTIYPYLKKQNTNKSRLKTLLREFLYKMNNPNNDVSPAAGELYLKALEILPADIFFVERHLQNWVAKRTYAEVILLPSHLSTREYFFLGSITKNGRIDSASKGYGMTLSQLAKEAGSENTRLALLLSFGVSHRDYEWDSTVEHVRRMMLQFNDFVNYLKKYKIKERPNRISDLLKSRNKEMEELIQRGNIRKILLIIFVELPRTIRSMLGTVPAMEKENYEVLDFFSGWFEILCPSLKEKLYGN
ncbi:MAG: hypothetical protein KGH56_00120 [Patescibacteria group bacterium]|nr:hypothetical protein [Patescibacteria group bacterium]